MKDNFGREINYMRISVTDRCNLRCKYCMPAEGVKKISREEILRADEIVKVCKAATHLGIDRFKITGGEPLVRGKCLEIIREIKGIPGVREVTMTTNGQVLADYLNELSDAGIDGINISLDTLQEDKYKDITRHGELQKTLDAIDLCIECGIKTKLNCLVQRGFNEDEITDLAEFALNKGIAMRFIELMPVGFADEDKFFSSDEVMNILRKAYPDIEEDEEVHGNGPAVYYKVPGRDGRLGLISSIRGKFCSKCNRIRLTSTGFVKPCLCYEEGTNIRPHIAGDEAELISALRQVIEAKPKEHCFENIAMVDHHAMSEIGG